MATWKELPDVHLLIVGDGPARAAVEEAARKAGTADRVHVTGAVKRPDMPDHIAAFDIALQPAATPYASPMKVFEYLAMGKPCIACDQPNLREILDDGESGLFFTPGDHAGLAQAAHGTALRRGAPGLHERARARGHLRARLPVEQERRARRGDGTLGDEEAVG